MKNTLFYIVGLIIAIGVIYAYSTVTVFSSKAMSNSLTGRNDTSSVIDLKGEEIVELSQSITGTDSAKIQIKVDAYIAGKWYPSYFTDSLILDNSAVNPCKGVLLRGYGTNNIKGVEKLRIHNIVYTGASDDSSSAMSYSQYILLR